MPYRKPSLAKNQERDTVNIGGINVPRYTGEFWTPKQRQSSSIHEISYRACFKAQLPRFFIELLTREGETVYDPFSGRGTTVIEAGLLGRNVIANDISPLSAVLCRPRFFSPPFDDLEQRLRSIKINPKARADLDLSMFYHRKTERELVSIRNYLERRKKAGKEDRLDQWIRMVATNRLTGHSRGFFSVYTLPPNQAVSQKSQTKINRRLRQKPEYRDTKRIILEKSLSLLRNMTELQIRNLKKAGRTAKFLTTDAAKAKQIRSESVHLTVTSPPFLNVVQYAHDNWLRCWFNSIDNEAVGNEMTMSSDLTNWSYEMEDVFAELYRVTRPGGWVAFEVGEVRNGTINLDEAIIPLATLTGFRCEGILINAQDFTKTSNIWGVRNNKYGTNTNRIALFYKE
jgi:DNA modification methylase